MNVAELRYHVSADTSARATARLRFGGSQANPSPLTDYHVIVTRTKVEGANLKSLLEHTVGTRGAIAGRVDSSKCRFCENSVHEVILLESDGAVAFASLGAFIEGWTLVVPKKHMLSLGEMSADAWRGYTRTLEGIRSRVERKFGPSVMFEHGSAGSGRTAGCGVDHAHMHVVPTTDSLRAIIADTPALQEFEWTPAADRPTAEPGMDYIWIADQTGHWITRAAELPSQVVRRALAHQRQITLWDWKDDLRLDVVQSTNLKLK